MKSYRGLGWMMAVALLAMGCRSNPLDFLAEKVTRPVAEIRVVTNIVTVPVVERVTNIVQGRDVVVIQTNFVETPVVEFRTNVVYVAEPALARGVTVAQGVAPFVPAGPFGPAIEIGLGLLAAGLAWLVRRRNGEKANLETQLQAVVTGVEKVAVALPEDGKRVKERIASVAQAMGVANELYKTVKKVTS